LATRGDRELRAGLDPLFLEVASTLDREWGRVFADAPVDAERVRKSRRQARALLQGLLLQLEVSPDPGDVGGDVELLKESILRILAARPSGEPGEPRDA
jgi:hypothetical protein